MNPLFNAKGEQIPPRPSLTDEMKKEGALKAVKSGHLSRVEEDDAEKFAIDIAKHYHNFIDAYDLAKNMENYGGWEVDSMFVDDMEQVDGYIQEIHRDAIESWSKAYQPVPSFEFGTELEAYSFSTSRHGGVIDGICEHTPAMYLVKMHDRPEDDTSRRLIKFEEAKLCKVAVGDVVEPIKHDYQLASGCGRYDSAVVVSVEPFVLVSHAADMRWQSTVKREQFKIVGKVEGEALEACMKRLEA
ncbi:hypothetical protein PL84_03570 [Vibrio anguillarum]|uniref:hypothetical protein n=1 Tax=Vibrio anguillarum TaxID=55601 RepID=UPI00097E3096|nr:hypothetical protein [Vibrio anguillarum]MBT2909660.1 hypothetical protein [Vibrio anguillarum]MBT2942489.1 hypothetical protein [Vibrio anguillarum]MBT2950687.1 hypothetical protein [Vibrio anguillarum]MBT2979508.1 hypothetical protein [Vibrio anguillarum]